MPIYLSLHKNICKTTLKTQFIVVEKERKSDDDSDAFLNWGFSNFSCVLEIFVCVNLKEALQFGSVMEEDGIYKRNKNEQTAKFYLVRFLG